uniref:Uncharacterized protein n=1 Tax=Sphaerodactylus townsendi TaxID=933632 RepID=A0ACB8F2M5_9SAUR
MNTEFEEQNTILQKHTESMSSAKERLEQELAMEERQTMALQQQLQAVRQALTASFASLPIPAILNLLRDSVLIGGDSSELNGPQCNNSAIASEVHMHAWGSKGAKHLAHILPHNSPARYANNIPSLEMEKWRESSFRCARKTSAFPRDMLTASGKKNLEAEHLGKCKESAGYPLTACPFLAACSSQ